MRFQMFSVLIMLFIRQLRTCWKVLLRKLRSRISRCLVLMATMLPVESMKIISNGWSRIAAPDRGLGIRLNGVDHLNNGFSVLKRRLFHQFLSGV